jgi:hypothetical protein
LNVKRYSLTHLSNQVLRHDLSAHAARVRGADTVFLAHIAEFDARRLYRADGYSAMSEYCIKALGLSEDAAYKRIWRRGPPTGSRPSSTPWPTADSI